jgi:2-oxo-4-hydroxy-4-carboxy-5-ureidoimidazoline decarboxylase
VPDLDWLNALAEPDARRELAGCCSSERWVSAVLAGRPYGSVESLLVRSDAAAAALTEADLTAALAGHPRIGDRKAASGWSRAEQAGVSADEAAELAAGNAAYEAKFGHIYLVCATGKSGRELLALLRERLGNEETAEWAVVAGELAKINRIRLEKLTGGDQG